MIFSRRSSWSRSLQTILGQRAELGSPEARYKGVQLALPDRNILLLVVLKHCYGENTITQVCITKWQGPCQCTVVNKPISGTAATILADAWLNVWFHSLPSRSSQLLYRSSYGLNRHIICITSPHLSNIWWCHKALKIPTGMHYCFCLTILAVKFPVLPLNLSYHYSWHSMYQRDMWTFHLFSSISLQIFHWGIGA